MLTMTYRVQITFKRYSCGYETTVSALSESDAKFTAVRRAQQSGWNFPVKKVAILEKYPEKA